MNETVAVDVETNQPITPVRTLAEKLSERTAARDILEIPEELNLLAKRVSLIMKQHGISKIEIIKFETVERVYLDTVDGAVYAATNGGSLEVRQRS